MTNKYQVVVSNIGTVYAGNDYDEARREFKECKELSKDSNSRLMGEDVTLFEDGEIIRHWPAQQADE